MHRLSNWLNLALVLGAWLSHGDKFSGQSCGTFPRRERTFAFAILHVVLRRLCGTIQPTVYGATVDQAFIDQARCVRLYCR